jgi:hypothetical protein
VKILRIVKNKFLRFFRWVNTQIVLESAIGMDIKHEDSVKDGQFVDAAFYKMEAEKLWAKWHKLMSDGGLS